MKLYIDTSKAIKINWAMLNPDKFPASSIIRRGAMQIVEAMTAEKYARRSRKSNNSTEP